MAAGLGNLPNQKFTKLTAQAACFLIGQLFNIFGFTNAFQNQRDHLPSTEKMQRSHKTCYTINHIGTVIDGHLLAKGFAADGCAGNQRSNTNRH